MVNDASRKLILVPIVFIVLRIWGTLRFVFNAHFVESNVMSWIVPLQVRVEASSCPVSTRIPAVRTDAVAVCGISCVSLFIRLVRYVSTDCVTNNNNT